jgi:hypothetical protein
LLAYGICSTGARRPPARKNFIGGDWAMSAQEFIDFRGESRMATVSTASRSGTAHAISLDIHLVDGRFYLPTFPDSIRLSDHRENARCVITSWDGLYRAVIAYGDAREVAADSTARTEATVEEQRYDRDQCVTIEVTPTRRSPRRELARQCAPLAPDTSPVYKRANA